MSGTMQSWNCMPESNERTSFLGSRASLFVIEFSWFLSWVDRLIGLPLSSTAWKLVYKNDSCQCFCYVVATFMLSSIAALTCFLWSSFPDSLVTCLIFVVYCFFCSRKTGRKEAIKFLYLTYLDDKEFVTYFIYLLVLIIQSQNVSVNELYLVYSLW